MNIFLTFRVLAMGAVAVMLVGCSSLAPVYGDRTALAAGAVRFQFSDPDTRLEQLVFDRLKLAFPGQALSTDPTLDLQVTSSSPASSMSNAFSVGRPVHVRVQASVTIAKDGYALFATTRYAETAYQSGKLTPVNIASRDGAEESAARSLAESIRAAILAGYRPGMPAEGSQ